MTKTDVDEFNRGRKHCKEGIFPLEESRAYMAGYAYQSVAILHGETAVLRVPALKNFLTQAKKDGFDLCPFLKD